MRRRVVRPFGSSITGMRAVSLLFMLAVLFMLYDRLRDPATWKWLAPDVPEARVEQPASPEKETKEPLPEVVAEGPNDLDEVEWNLWKMRSQLIVDRAPLKVREMPAYWQLMGWARTQPFREFERRAAGEPSFVQFWDEPNVHRGKPFRLRLHVRRVLHYTATENPLGLQDLYEVWGWTDGSKSYPYVVVIPEKPPGLPIGDDIQAEAVFVGYYFKIMAYTAFDTPRGAPLLIGRVRSFKSPLAAAREKSTSSLSAFEIIGLFAVVAIIVGGWLVLRRKPTKTVLPDQLNFEFNPLKIATDDPPAEEAEATNNIIVGDIPHDRPEAEDPAAVKAE